MKKDDARRLYYGSVTEPQKGIFLAPSTPSELKHGRLSHDSNQEIIFRTILNLTDGVKR